VTYRVALDLKRENPYTIFDAGIHQPGRRLILCNLMSRMSWAVIRAAYSPLGDPDKQLLGSPQRREGNINISFSSTLEDSEKAWLAFDKSSRFGKFFYRFGFLTISVIAFLIAFINNLTARGKYPPTGNSSPLSSFLGWVWISTPLCLFFGWLIYAMVKAGRKNSIIERLKKIPPESFGSISVSIDQTGVGLQAPLGHAQYDWKWVKTIRMTPDFLFICSESGLLVWIPISALGTQVTGFVSEIEKWTMLKTQIIKT
jgi:hypothetical protein